MLFMSLFERIYYEVLAIDALSCDFYTYIVRSVSSSHELLCPFKFSGLCSVCMNFSHVFATYFVVYINY